MQCQYCHKENLEGWFYCRSCGKRASAIKFTTNLWMMSDLGKRTDMEFSSQTMDESIEEMRRSRYA
jgi:hypothetical protein